MKCRNCRFENSAGAKFCSECGSKLELGCPQCDRVNPPGSKFCNECGYNLAQDAGLVKLSNLSQQPDSTATQTETAILNEGERRQATIVFSDLSGYPSMNERLLA